MSNRPYSNSSRRIAERIRRTVATVEPDLMRPVSVGEAHPVVLGELEAPARVDVSHHLGAWNSLRIELLVPRRVERVRPLYAFAVAVDLHHLRSSCIWLPGRVRLAASNAADALRS